MPETAVTILGRLDAADHLALAGLGGLGKHLSSARAAWWEWPDGTPLQALNMAADMAGVQHLEAHADGRCCLRLALLFAQDSGAPGLAAVLQAAAALIRARWQAEASRLEAERLLDAGRAASDWLWETDAHGAVTWMTDSIAVLTGRTVTEEIGTRTTDHNIVRTDEYAESYQRYLADRAARRPIHDLVLDRQTPNGMITVSISGSPRFDADGRFLGYRGATRNITAEVQARAEARSAQLLLQQTLEGVPAGVMISGPDGGILMSNARWREGLGEEVPPDCKTWTDVIRHHVRAGHYPLAAGREEEFIAWRLAQASATPVAVEMPWRDEWVMVVDRLLPDGCVVHLSIFVTERKRAEMALAHAEDRWRFALDGAGHGVWDWDHETGIYYSPSWKSMLGYGDEEIGNQRREWIDRIHPDDRQAALAEFNRHRRGETAVYETEYRLRRKDGQYIWVHDRGRALRRDAQGWPLRVVGTHSDITRLRLADQALYDKQAAETVSRSMSEFLSRMSHEMRTPLNAVIGFAELLHLRGEYRADTVEHILAAGRHLLGLINDVLDLQQVEQGGLSLRSSGVQVSAVVQDAQGLLRAQADKLGLVTHFDGMVAACVHADRQRLRQVLLNLGSNAIKYNRPGGQVRWSVDDGDPQRFGIVIEDTGPGLDATQLARLFRPFERLGRETSGTEGSGLGLLIARRLLEAMGGELGIASQPGVGTRVTAWLPRAEADSNASGQPAVAAAPSAQAGGVQLPQPEGSQGARPALRVLYVEDNPLNALLFSEALRRHPDLSVRLAADGQEALTVAAVWRPDLLAIDMHLPGANGTEVLRTLRRLPGLQSVPAVVCSADAMPQDRERALAAGFEGYWTKPLDIRRLPDDIRAAIGAATGVGRGPPPA